MNRKQRRSWTKSKATNKGRILPKGDRDHRVTLSAKGRNEHQRLFAGKQTGPRVSMGKAWKSNRIGWIPANAIPGDVVTIVTDGKAVKEKSK